MNISRMIQLLTQFMKSTQNHQYAHIIFFLVTSFLTKLWQIAKIKDAQPWNKRDVKLELGNGMGLRCGAGGGYTHTHSWLAKPGGAGDAVRAGGETVGDTRKDVIRCDKICMVPSTLFSFVLKMYPLCFFKSLASIN